MKLTKFFAVAVAALAFASCQDKTTNVTEGPIAKATISIDRGTKAPAGTLPGSDVENKINTIDIYVFNSDGSNDTKNAYISLNALPANNKIQLEVTAGTDKKFVVVTNLVLGAVANYTELKSKLTDADILNDLTSRTPRAAGFLMAGETKALIVANESSNQVSIALDRLVSKINAPTTKSTVVEIPNDLITDILPNADPVANAVQFNLDGYVVINGMDKSSVVFGAADKLPTTDWTAAWRTGKTNFKTQYDASGHITNVYSGNAPTFWLTDLSATAPAVYIYENDPLEASNPQISGYAHNSVISFLIKGTITVGAESAVRYWRIDINKVDNFRLLRNSIFNVDITKVLTPGFGTPEEAEEDEQIITPNGTTGVVITVTINPWQVNAEGVGI